MLIPDNKTCSFLPPPAYSPHAPHMAPSGLPAQNHLYIHKDNSAITGSYLIDVSLPGGYGKNLSLSSNNGAIDATVYLEGEGKGADIEATSRNGHVNRDRPHVLPLNLLASTRNGSVTAALPPDFVGSVTIRTRNGQVFIRPSLDSRLRVIEDRPEEKRYWVGHGSGEDEEKNWTSDQCLLDTLNGAVTVGLSNEYMKDELQEKEAEPSAWFCALPWCG